MKRILLYLAGVAVGAMVLGSICGIAGWALDPCPMSVGDFAGEGVISGAILGIIVGAFSMHKRLARRPDQPGSLPEPAADSDTEAPTGP